MSKLNFRDYSLNKAEMRSFSKNLKKLETKLISDLSRTDYVAQICGKWAIPVRKSRQRTNKALIQLQRFKASIEYLTELKKIA